MLQRLQKSVVALLLMVITVVGTMPVPVSAVDIAIDPTKVEMAMPIVHSEDSVTLVADITAVGPGEAMIRFALDTDPNELTIESAEIRTPLEGPVFAGDVYEYTLDNVLDPDTTYYAMACLHRRTHIPVCSDTFELTPRAYLPLLDTHIPVQIDADTFEFHGEVIDDGMSPDLSARFIYSTNPDELVPGYTGTRTPVTQEIYTTGDMIVQEHDVVLEPGMTYYVRVCSVERHRDEEFCGDIEEFVVADEVGPNECWAKGIEVEGCGDDNGDDDAGYDGSDLDCSDCTTVIVSDEMTHVAENNTPASELSFVHSAWTADIPEAAWIWEQDGVGAPTTEETFTFTRYFYWSGDAAAANLDVAADNEYTVRLNGNAVGGDSNANNFALATQDSYDVLAYLEQGVNFLEIEVTNLSGSSNPQANPAGVLYRLEIDGDCTCDDDEQAETYMCAAQEVVDFDQAKRNDGEDIAADRSNPDRALGEPQDNDTFNFVSLGFGGEIILDFGAAVLNQDGDDLRVFETSFSAPADLDYPEAASVYGSQDGNTWQLLAENDIQDIDIDLGDFDWIRFLKIVDTTSGEDFNDTADGFDVDGVKAYTCQDLPEDEGDTNGGAGGGDEEEEDTDNTLVRVETLPVTTEDDEEDLMIVFNGRLLEDGLGGRTGLRFEYAAHPWLLDMVHGSRTLVEYGDFEVPHEFFATLAEDVVPSPVYVRACAADRGSEWVCGETVTYPVVDDTDDTDSGEEENTDDSDNNSDDGNNGNDDSDSGDEGSTSTSGGSISGGSSRSSSGGTGDGTDLVIAVTSPATEVGVQGATLHGAAISEACDYDAYFEVFQNNELILTIGNVSAPAGVSTPIHHGIETFAPGTTYTFRTVVEDCNGRVEGDLLEFTTPVVVLPTPAELGQNFFGVGGGEDGLINTAEAASVDEAGDEALSAADLAAAQLARTGISGRGRFWLWILLIILGTMLARSLRDDIRTWQMRRRTMTA